MLPVPGVWPHALPFGSRGPLLVADAPRPSGPWTTARAARGKTRRAGARHGTRGRWAVASSSVIQRFLRRAPELSETFLARLKQLAGRHRWPWNYAPLHQHLREARAQGVCRSRSLRPEGDPDDNRQP